MFAKLIKHNRLALPKSQYTSVFNARRIVYMSRSGYKPIIGERANMSYNRYIDDEKEKQREERNSNILMVVVVCGLSAFNYYFDNYSNFKKELMAEMKEIKNEITAKTSPRFVRCSHCNGTVEANPIVSEPTQDN